MFLIGHESKVAFELPMLNTMKPESGDGCRATSIPASLPSEDCRFTTVAFVHPKAVHAITSHVVRRMRFSSFPTG
jgi:hypothetical protein